MEMAAHLGLFCIFLESIEPGIFVPETLLPLKQTGLWIPRVSSPTLGQQMEGISVLQSPQGSSERDTEDLGCQMSCDEVYHSEMKAVYNKSAGCELNTFHELTRVFPRFIALVLQKKIISKILAYNILQKIDGHLGSLHFNTNIYIEIIVALYKYIMMQQPGTLVEVVLKYIHSKSQNPVQSYLGLLDKTFGIHSTAMLIG